MDAFSKIAVEGMIRKYGNVEETYRNFGGYDVFVLSNGVTIRLPIGYARIPYDHVELIAQVKLDIPQWEFDYWIGQQPNDIN